MVRSRVWDESTAANAIRWLGGEDRTDEYWALRPTLEDFRLWDSARGARAHLAPLALTTKKLPRLIQVGQYRFVYVTENQRRALLPVAGALARKSDEVLREAAPKITLPARLAHLVKHSSRAVAKPGRRALQLLDGGATDTAWRAAIARYEATRRTVPMMVPAETRMVIVSTQQDPSIRAVLQYAEGEGIPSSYVAHAPLTRKPHYKDLPVNLAFVRGDQEREIYGRLGASVDHVIAGGNPAVDALERPTAGRFSGPIVVAVSPDPRETLEQVFRLCEGLPSEWVIVAPHPRSNMRELAELVPHGWAIHSGATIKLLTSGAAGLIQYSSGVAWESLALGVPTLQLELSSSPGDYYFIDDPRIPRARKPAEVLSWAQSIRRCRAVSYSGLRTVARDWCALDAGQSAASIADHIVSFEFDGAPRVLDGWAGDGPAQAASTLASLARQRFLRDRSPVRASSASDE